MILSIGLKEVKVNNFEDNLFWNIKAGEEEDIIILDDSNKILRGHRVENWDFKPNPLIWVVGENDPAYEMGWDKKVKFRGFIPVAVMNKETKEYEPKIWAVGSQVWNTIVAYSKKLKGKTFGLIVSVSREGEGLNTVYTVMTMGQYEEEIAEKLKLSEEKILEQLGPKNRKEIIELVEQRTGKSYASLIGSGDVSNNSEINLGEDRNNNGEDEEINADDLF